jgi:hypothetical protein
MAASYPVWTMTVAGASHALAANQVKLARWSAFRKDGHSDLSWTVEGGALPTGADPYLGKVITLSADGALKFTGDCQDGPDWTFNGKAGGSRTYTASGISARAEHIPVTNPTDGTDAIGFNLPEEDQLYRAELGGLSVGEILLYVMHSPDNAVALNAAGLGGFNVAGAYGASATAIESGGAISVTIDEGGTGYTSAPRVALMGGDGTYTSASATVSGGAVTAISVSGSTGYTVPPKVLISPIAQATLDDLSMMDWEPPNQVIVSGEKLWTAMVGVLSTWAPNHWLYATPAGTIRVFDPRTFAATVLTIGDDPVYADGLQMRRSIADCYTRVRVRGGPNAVPVLFSTRDGTLEEYFDWGTNDNTEAKAAWSLPDFTEQAEIEGTASCTSTTEVEFDPTDAALAFAADTFDQSGRKGVLVLVDSTGSGIDQLYSAKVLSHTSLAAAGTCDITLDRPLPVLTYDTARLIGTAGGAADVWREYRVVDTTQRAALLTHFPFPVYDLQVDGTAGSGVSYPIAKVCWSSSGNPPFSVSACPVTVNPDTGTFLLGRPSVTFFGSQSNLDVPGGANASNIPSDLRILAPVQDGQLEAILPADSKGSPTYEGTAYTVEGLARTYTATVPTWIDNANNANMAKLAREILDSTKDAVLEGLVPLVGCHLDWLEPGLAMTLEGNGFTTPWEADDIPVVAGELIFDGGPQYWTRLQVSNRRLPLRADAYDRPAAEAVLLGAGFTGFSGWEQRGSSAFMGFTGAIGNMPTGTGNGIADAASAMVGSIVNRASGMVGGIMGGAAGMVGNATDWSRTHVLNTAVINTNAHGYAASQARAVAAGAKRDQMPGGAGSTDDKDLPFAGGY